MLSTLVLVACAGGPAPGVPSSGTPIDRWEMDVLMEAIRHVQRDATGVLLLEARTRVITHERASSEHLSAELVTLFSEEAASDFDRRNMGPVPTRLPNDLMGSVVLIEPNTVNLAMLSREEWDALRAQFPRLEGVVAISRPGFDLAGDGAVLLLEFRCGPGCGNGRLLLMRRSEDVWGVQDSRTLWLGP